MLNSENKRVGYTEVYYNYNADKFFTEDFGNQFKELPVSFSGGGGGLQSGDNISLLTNDVGYLTSYSFPSVTSLPTTNLSLGKVVALSTDNRPYFYDGTNWRRLFLADAPPAAGDPDTDWDKVILRCPFNTTIHDVKSNIQGSTQGSLQGIVGSPRKFGAGALKVQGASYIQYPGAGVGAFLDNDFTIEFWLYIDSYIQNQNTGIFNKGTTYFYFDYVGLNQVRFRINLTNTSPHTTISYNTIGLSAQNWVHLAYCRNATSGACQLFVDGISAGSGSLNNMVDSTVNNFVIGDLFNLQADMFIDDLRISNFERYTSNFNPPTAELPTSGS